MEMACTSGMAYHFLKAPHLIVDVIAYDVVACAHDIPDPRLTHTGPWTPGWTPL